MTVAHWLCSKKEAWCLCYAYQKINVKGKVIGHSPAPFKGVDRRGIQDICRGRGYHYLGAASAYRRDVIDIFPWADYERTSDDSVFTIRCAMLGKLYAILEELVQYRVGCGETTRRANYRETMAKGITYCAVSQQQLLLDVDVIKQKLSVEVYREFKESLTKFLRHEREVLKLYEGRTFNERLQGLEAVGGSLFFKQGLIGLALLLPHGMADYLLCLLGKFQALFLG